MQEDAYFAALGIIEPSSIEGINPYLMEALRKKEEIIRYCHSQQGYNYQQFFTTPS